MDTIQAKGKNFIDKTGKVGGTVLFTGVGLVAMTVTGLFKGTGWVLGKALHALRQAPQSKKQKLLASMTDEQLEEAINATLEPSDRALHEMLLEEQALRKLAHMQK